MHSLLLKFAEVHRTSKRASSLFRTSGKLTAVCPSMVCECMHVFKYVCVCMHVWIHICMQAFKRMRGLESIFMPGGDGGSLDWDAIRKIAVELREARGNNTSAGVWVCAVVLLL